MAMRNCIAIFIFCIYFFAVYFLLESTEKNVRTFDLKRAHALFRMNARFK